MYPLFIIILFSTQARAESLGYVELSRLDNKAFAKKIEAIAEQARDIDDEEKFYERTQILKKATIMALSRPNKDNALIEVMPILKVELRKDSAYEETLLSITKASIRTLQNDKSTPQSAATQLFILENMLSEVRPCLKTHPTCKDILVAIKDAELKVPNRAKSFRKMNGMFKTYSPSILAERLYKSTFEVSK